MKRIGSVGLILAVVLLTGAALQAQDDILPRGEPGVRPVAVAPSRAPVAVAAPAVATTTDAARAPSMTAPDSFPPVELTGLDSLDNFEEAFRIVVHVLQLTEDQALGLKHLLEMRREAVVPLLQAIAQREMQIQQLLQTGGSPAEIGQLVIEIHQLKQLIQQAQQTFMAAFFDLLNEEQERRFHQIALAERLQPVLPAFKALHLL